MADDGQRRPTCGRRLEGHWVNQRPAYRCRHGHTSAHPTNPDAPRWVYWSQALLVYDLNAAEPDLAGLAAAAEDLASFLRSRDRVIVCGPGTLTIEAAAAEETTTDATSATVVPVELELPIPPGSQRRRGRRTRARSAVDRVPGRRRKTQKPPAEPHMKREELAWGLTCPDRHRPMPNSVPAYPRPSHCNSNGGTRRGRIRPYYDVRR